MRERLSRRMEPPRSGVPIGEGEAMKKLLCGDPRRETVTVAPTIIASVRWPTTSLLHLTLGRSPLQLRRRH
jgi:hypothetical protein